MGVFKIFSIVLLLVYNIFITCSIYIVSSFYRVDSLGGYFYLCLSIAFVFFISTMLFIVKKKYSYLFIVFYTFIGCFLAFNITFFSYFKFLPSVVALIYMILKNKESVKKN